MFPYDRWSPLSLAHLRNVFADAPFSWCLAGGYAVEKFVGRSYREHGDVDVVVFRRDQIEAQTHLAGWQLYAAGPPRTLRPWRPHDYLPLGIHDIWGHRDTSQSWELQIMLQEGDAETWYYRRDRAVSGRRSDFTEEYDGWPCIRIEIQLLYKSKGLRDKDQVDFAKCLPLLSHQRRAALGEYLQTVYPEGHPWLEGLE